MEALLTVPEVAPKARLSEQGLYRAIREGQFPAVRIGAKIRIPESALQRWIEQQMEQQSRTPGQDEKLAATA
jgi:excisionase family DNA binding protein